MYYGPNPPFNALKIIVSRVNGIVAKLAYVKAPIMIKKGERSGPKPMTYWKERA